MSASIIAATALVVAHIAGYLLYQSYIRERKIDPEPTTWGLWCLDTALNVYTYFDGTGGDVAQNILPIVDCAGAVYIFYLSWRLGNFSRPEGVEIVASLCAALAFGILLYYHDALGANVVIQVGGLVAASPLIIRLARRGATERPWPWLWWSLAYALEFTIVLGKYHGPGQFLAHWEEFVFPLACFTSHFAVAILALCNPKNRFGPRG